MNLLYCFVDIFYECKEMYLRVRTVGMISLFKPNTIYYYILYIRHLRIFTVRSQELWSRALTTTRMLFTKSRM